MARSDAAELIRVYNVFSYNILIEFELNWKIISNTPKIGNGLVLLIRVGKFIRLKWVKRICLKTDLTLMRLVSQPRKQPN